MALVLGMMTPTVVTAEPQVLADRDLDAVTAAGVLVDVRSVASAIGDHVAADTSALTLVRGRRLVQVGVGVSDGYALACCDEQSDVALASTAVGAGDLVYGTTYTFEFRGATYDVDGGLSHFAYGYTAAFLLALSFEDGFEAVQQTVQQPRLEVRGMADAVRGLTGGSRDGFATAFDLATVIAAGMRWQAAQDLAAGYQGMRQLPKDTRPSVDPIQ